MSVVEPEMTEFLRRLFPDFERQCSGATAEQIESIERIAGRPLPPFYLWFLRTMGRSVGPFAKARQDLRVDSILAAYEQGWAEPDSRFLLIATDTEKDDPMLAFYDLDAPLRDDALVVLQQDYDGYRTPTYETFREMLAQANLIAFRIHEFPCYCDGKLKDQDGDVPAAVDAVAQDLGFVSTVPSGPYCKVLERADAAMTITAAPDEYARSLMFFDLGANDEATVRRVLGEISTAGGLDVHVRRWGGPDASQPG